MAKLYKSVLMCELFQPIQTEEKRIIETSKIIAGSGNHHMLEIAPLLQKDSQVEFRNLIEKNNMYSLVWAAHVLWAENLNALSSLDSSLREKAIKRCIDLINVSVEMGSTYLGLPTGDDVGSALRPDGIKALTDSVNRLAEIAEKYNLLLLVEPMDRYVHKKAIIGPIDEAVDWIKEVRKESDNVFLHWDSGHEVLGDIGYLESLRIAKDYFASFHLANAILDKSHPCFGDWHMDVGQAPDFATEGYLTVEVGAEILKEVASYPELDKNPFVHVSMEVRSHMGDDMWHKFETSEKYLDECFKRAGLEC